MAASTPTCDLNSFPSFESLNATKGVSLGGLSTSNDTLIAMQNCCAPNPVHAVGDCDLWCEIPSNITSQGEWGDCVNLYVKEPHGTAYRSEGAMATVGRPTMMGIAMMTLLVSGLYVM
ncbi:hypothetical protein GGR51DRAFT_500907 [Nemania sp. FL0031]|nr:hypothetical protein GGR51DRAFT_500907 [Nemania sp. FL0031]